MNINMNIVQKRFLLFLIGCIPVRLLLVYLSKTLSTKYLTWMAYLALIPAIGFFYIYLTNSRKTGGEVFGDKIWWNNLRPVHGLLYMVFAVLVFTKNTNIAWIPLLIDVLIGLSNFFYYHYSVGNFTQLVQ